ncbi:MAG: UDP-N-acetylmuramoyl-tripeptide--D-alanyl-D-alanine ligase [Candidatus Hydrogenedentota bacterium]
MPWRHTLEDFAQAAGAAPPKHPVAFSRISTDTRNILPGDLFLALRGPQFDANDFLEHALDKGAAAVVGQRAISKGPCVVVEDGLAALQQFAAWHRSLFDIPVLAITGSCGKTTAKDLTATLLGTRYVVAKTAGNLNNEIGLPQSLLHIDNETDFAVLEMGANHPGEIAHLCTLAQPTESAITMVSAAHLEGFGAVEDVARAKAEIMEGLPPDGCFFVNMDDPHCRAIGDRYTGDTMRFGAQGDVILRGCARLPNGELAMDIDPVGRLTLPLLVRAHTTNLLLAVAVALRHGVDVSAFGPVLRAACQALARFRVYGVGPLHVLDDTYNANPASMAAALETLGEQPGTGAKMAALGAMLELGETAEARHAEVGALAARHGVTHLYAYGPHAQAMAAAAQSAGVLEGAAVASHEDIARRIATQARPGDALLIKGSRGMRMERVIEALRTHYSEHTDGAKGRGE